MPRSTAASPRSKPQLRAHFRAARSALTAQQRADFSARICAHILSFLDSLDTPPRAVALYLATPHEANLDVLIEPLHARGVRVAAPRGDGFALVQDASTCSALSAQSWREASGAAIRMEEIDIVLLPGVAFGYDGSRLGQGGGWFDRALQHSSALLIGVCFSCQMTDVLPSEDHDIVMQWIATEDGVAAAFEEKR